MEEQMNGQRPGLMMAADGSRQMPSTDGAKPSPEEQAMYDAVVANGIKLIYSPNTYPKVLKALEGGGSPQEGLTQAAVSVLSRLQSSMAKAGKQVPSDIMYKAGVEIFEDLAYLAGKAQIHDFESDPKAMEGAFYAALDRIGASMAGQVNPEQAKAEWGALQQAEQSGELEQTFRSLVGAKPKEQAQPARRGLMPKENA